MNVIAIDSLLEQLQLAHNNNCCFELNPDDIYAITSEITRLKLALAHYADPHLYPDTFTANFARSVLGASEFKTNYENCNGANCICHTVGTQATCKCLCHPHDIEGYEIPF